MNINPLQGQNHFYAYPAAYAPQDETHPNNRMARTQESGEANNDRCETCHSRTYQDVSDDPGVSFQAPTRLTPGQAATAVPSHEREHYTREAAKAQREGRDVIHNSIRIFTDVCPECGIKYISGGETRTVTRDSGEDEGPHQQGEDGRQGGGFEVLA